MYMHLGHISARQNTTNQPQTLKQTMQNRGKDVVKYRTEQNQMQASKT